MARGSREGRNRLKRIGVAFEADRDGFWLGRWLRARDIEVHVVHPSSVAVSREHRTPRGTREPMIVALARKLLIDLWRLVREGTVPEGIVLRPAQ
jgi:hypothetical protein